MLIFTFLPFLSAVVSSVLCKDMQNASRPWKFRPTSLEGSSFLCRLFMSHQFLERLDDILVWFWSTISRSQSMRVVRIDKAVTEQQNRISPAPKSCYYFCGAQAVGGGGGGLTGVTGISRHISWILKLIPFVVEEVVVSACTVAVKPTKSFSPEQKLQQILD